MDKYFIIFICFQLCTGQYNKNVNPYLETDPIILKAKQFLVQLRNSGFKSFGTSEDSNGTSEYSNGFRSFDIIKSSNYQIDKSCCEDCTDFQHKPPYHGIQYSLNSITSEGKFLT